MNFYTQIELIKTILSNNGFEELAVDILKYQSAGGTGGEVLISVCSRLLGYKNRTPKAYQLIALEAENLISYAKSIGLSPIASY